MFLQILEEYDLLQFMFIFYIIAISIGGLLVNFLSDILKPPNILIQMFKYGKMAENKRKIYFVSILEIPKRWFCHFYISASLLAITAVSDMAILYLSGHHIIPGIYLILNVLTVEERKPTNDKMISAICLGLFTCHILRRLYENLFISVFGPGKINLTHYIVGHTHYIGALTYLLYTAPGYAHYDGDVAVSSSIDMIQIIGLIIYCCGFYIQHNSLKYLASLRTIKDDPQAVNKHMMPKGAIFDFVSCPHMMAEILIYVGLGLFMHWRNNGWMLVTVWVISNQIQVAVMNHQWYKNTFKDYPKFRKAIIPYIL